MQPWLIWLLVAAGLMITETVTPAFVMFFFGLGAIAAAIAAAINPQSYAMQTVVFAIASVAFLTLLRTRLQRIFLGRSSDKEKSLYDLALGQEGQAVTALAPGSPGTVRYSGTTWQAKSEDCILAGQRVIIVGRDQANRSTLLVRRHPDSATAC